MTTLEKFTKKISALRNEIIKESTKEFAKSDELHSCAQRLLSDSHKASVRGEQLDQLASSLGE